ncbi:FG-GAP repeat protein [Pedobacter sp. ASV28]|uniref:FG-GAP repeat protein n=1 Tax=Pedobacter sp. ASV28 TaxID=2795123 RepID=UPI0018EDF6B1|nr:FG-GAP repeat protein [Pedobacter sp. ASV28]
MRKHLYLILTMTLLFKQWGHCQNFQPFLTLSAPERLLYDRFALNCEISENLVVVGAPEGDLMSNNAAQIFDAGYICIYERLSRGDWKNPVKIYAPSPQEVGHFGQGIALHNKKILVGEPLYNASDSTSYKQAGRAWLYYKDQFDHWRTAKALTPKEQMTNAWFGYAVALTDSNAFISAPMMKINGTKLIEGAGGVYVFKLNDENQEEVQLLTSPMATVGEQFGNALAANNQTLIVAAHRSDLNGAKTYNSTGAVYIYESTVGGKWIFKQELRIPMPVGYENFGNAISLSKDYIVVGACQDSFDDKNLNRIKNAGAAYVYRKSKISKKWELEQKIVSPSRTEGELFGFSVSINGDKLAVASPLKATSKSEKDKNDSGSVFLYHKNKMGKWELIQTILPATHSVNFGSSVKLSEKWLGIGAYRAELDENGQNPKIDAGLAYLMEY